MRITNCISCSFHNNYLYIDSDQVCDPGGKQVPAGVCSGPGLPERDDRHLSRASPLSSVPPLCSVWHGQRAPSNGERGASGGRGVCSATGCWGWTFNTCGPVLPGHREHVGVRHTGVTDGRRVCDTTSCSIPAVWLHKNTTTSPMWVQCKTSCQTRL